MKVLLINGSPKGKTSNSLKLASSFIEGVRDAIDNKEDFVVDELNLATMNISPCKGCFVCWKNTPGVCCMKDGMQTVIEKELEADMVVWSFPLYYFNVPGLLKNLIDRQLPMVLPFMSENESDLGSGGHDSRYDLKGLKHVLISTCGFYSAEGNYDSVTRMFDHFLGQGNYETIFCGQGELFRVKELSQRTGEYLEIVKKAGSEYIKGKISDSTKEDLKKLLYPKDVFEKMADASWGVSKETGEKEAEDLVFTKQMAALYNKEAYDGKDRVLEMNYTDLGKTYQIKLGKDGSEVFTGKSLEATTVIDTPYEVWLAISRGEISGTEALGKKMYKVNGDFSLMINWDKFFGASDVKPKESTSKVKEEKTASMATMLIPWIAFWIAVSINPTIGALITMVICAFVPLIMGKHKFVIWDRLSIAIVAVLSLVAAITKQGDLITTIGYAVFGLVWLTSCLFKEPLCATYVKSSYGGESAYKNPLFMKTNYILAAAWGVLYLLTAAWTFILKGMGFGVATIIINNLVPILMGMFTAWFVNFYPAHLAKG